ncbi:scavenger receptor class F member 1-like [Haliotis rufescens]|uniref:scavenger receptor class F member 1-like n=1 Tax=Haliotis rufescens TaxID=6454 RepID=UPI00201FA098|nr:scavenger receptor class F member 1-like [Haliotis rufescens]XP_046365809.2 scavenger receptor class F member 1-like [Haliotis rufescens]XP_046365824.2 scavenger receptor class F member 1-like [Haliotis rufescens]
MRISDYIKSMRAPVLILVLLICISCLRAEGHTTHCDPPHHPPPCEKCEENQWYGENCTKACSSGCYEQLCNKTTGRCESCKAGYRSFNCTLECPPNCLNDPDKPAKCDQNTAHCTNCQPTWWGLNCANKCDSNCKDGVCDFERGHCHECKVGERGDKCSEDCPKGCWLNECRRDNMTCTCTNGTCIIRNSNSSNSDRITGSDDPISQIVVPIVLSIVIVLVVLVICKIRSKIFRLCRPSRPLSDEADTCLRA